MRRFLSLLLICGLLFTPNSDAFRMGMGKSIAMSKARDPQVAKYPDILKLPDGLTFYADYENKYGDINAAYSVGSPTATFSRSATNDVCTYIDSNGVIRLASANTPRFVGGYYDSTGFHAKRGLMVEGAGTNQVRNSYCSIDATSDGIADYWAASTANGSVPTLVDVSAISSILGSKAQRSEATFDSVPGQYTARITHATANDSFINTGSLTITVSFWARGSMAGITSTTEQYWTKCDLLDNSSVYQSQLYSRGISLAAGDGLSPTVWRRFSFTGTTTDTDVRKLAVFFVQTNNSTAGLRPQIGESYWIEVFGLQAEASPYATSFIPTTTASATRNAETLKYAIAGNRTAAQESEFIKVSPYRNSVTGSTHNYISDVDSDQRGMEFTSNDIVVRSGYTGMQINDLINDTYNSNISMVVGWTMQTSSAPYMYSYWNGVQDGTPGSDLGGAYSPGEYFYIGSKNTGDTQLDGIVQKVALFNRSPSANEALAVAEIMGHD